MRKKLILNIIPQQLDKMLEVSELH
ncbi:uncharacterized protein METZ01_LOCUS441378, partial [marine metagenome]